MSTPLSFISVAMPTAKLRERAPSYVHYTVETPAGVVNLKHHKTGPVRDRRWTWVAPDGTTHNDAVRGMGGYFLGHQTKSSALMGIKRWAFAKLNPDYPVASY